MSTAAESILSPELLRAFDPLGTLSAPRLKEFADLCFVDRVGRGHELFRMHDAPDQLAFLVAGDVELSFADGTTERVCAGTPAARSALTRPKGIVAGIAATDVDLIRIDRDLLDIMLTWDQLADFDASRTGRLKVLAQDDSSLMPQWKVMSGVFSLSNLRTGAFSNLPSAHIAELLNRFARMEVDAGDIVIREGDEGDYYYVIEAGRAVVTRLVGGVVVTLADLKSGDAFGEEALVSDAKRNATVTMKLPGVLLRLAKHDFIALLKEPLLNRISAEAANGKVAAGAQWLDVRYPSEFQYDRLPGAINIPLAEIRNAFSVLDKSREYVIYCQSGRRSSAAAFLLAHRGFKVSLLDGGLWAARKTA
jgi:rhodanese-related sulfurtransferase